MGELVAGTISKVRVENFMCHSNLTVELIDNVNFITGQNGSGKSAILTALCVAFGCKARGTQRASSLKDFIKTGCSYALVSVELKNEGPDAFKPETYGSRIYIERRITGTATTTALKDQHGRKVASKKGELADLIDHFNIDVENPCVIMSQDKSREFLHSGTDQQKFKFFYKATLLQQVAELLDENRTNLEACDMYLEQNEETFRPYEDELAKLDEEIRRTQAVDEMAQELGILKKKLAWSWVFGVDRDIEKAESEVIRLQRRIPKCQQKIDEEKAKQEAKMQAHLTTREAVEEQMRKVDERKKEQDERYQRFAEATSDLAALQDQLRTKRRSLQAKQATKRRLEAGVRDMEERFLRNTQAEEDRRSGEIKQLEEEIRSLTVEVEDLRGGIERKDAELTDIREHIEKMDSELREKGNSCEHLRDVIRRLYSQRGNRIAAFGGDEVLRLLRYIEDNHQHFRRCPIGPIGAHLALVGDASWALAVETSVGNLFNAFIVTDHKDMQLLRQLARQCGYHRLQIFIYNFEHPALNLPPNMLPDQTLVTVLSILRSDSVTVKNLLIDQGSVERQVLAKDYHEGKAVAFDRRRHPNVKEVITLDGTRMYSRGGAQTTLPNEGRRRERLGVGIDDRIRDAERELDEASTALETVQSRKRKATDILQQVGQESNDLKRRKLNAERRIGSQSRALGVLKQQAEEAQSCDMPNVTELHDEIRDVERDASELQQAVETLQEQLSSMQDRCDTAKAFHDELGDALKQDSDELDRLDKELGKLEEEANDAANAVDYYTNVMNVQVLAEINKGQDEITRLRALRQENYGKASQICAEEDIQALGGVNATAEQLSSQLTRLQNQVREAARNVTPAEELQQAKLRIERKIFKKKNLHTQLKMKVQKLWNIYEKRQSKFEQNACYLRRQLRWQFNTHLKDKAFSGQVLIDYEAKTLKLEVLMPQDASNSAVRDTRALSGGERSFSTLCFALALHEMTEAPFRAMDEFDVFMDQVSRNVSLNKVVDFALSQGSQWIFITPHDISGVQNHARLKKQQMTAPRS